MVRKKIKRLTLEQEYQVIKDQLSNQINSEDYKTNMQILNEEKNDKERVYSEKIISEQLNFQNQEIVIQRKMSNRKETNYSFTSSISFKTAQQSKLIDLHNNLDFLISEAEETKEIGDSLHTKFEQIERESKISSN